MPLKLTFCPQHSVQQADLPGRVLSLSVWHRESLGRNIFLGEVEVPLDTWDWDSEATWLPLQPRVRAGVQSQIFLLYPTGPLDQAPTERFTERSSLGLILIPLGQACQPGHLFPGCAAIGLLSRSSLPNTLLYCVSTDTPTPGLFRFPPLQMSFPVGDCCLCPLSMSLPAQRVSDCQARG